MKTWKKVIAIGLTVTLSVSAGIIGTVAYLTDRDSDVNVFTVGDVSIDLEEGFEQGTTLLPGQKIEKEATITNTGKNDAWVWATIAIPSLLDSNDASQNVIHFNYSEESVGEGYWNWKKADGTWNVQENVTIDESGIFYNVYTVLYETALKPSEKTAHPVMHQVYMDTHVDIDPDGNWNWVEAGVATDLEWNTSEYGNPMIYVSAYAIQKEGFESVQAAYDAYGVQWGENGSEYATPATVYEYAGVAYVTAGDTVTATSNGGDTIPRGIVSDKKTTATKVVVGEGITTLGNRSIAKSPNIATVTLPSTLTTIQESAFQESGITSIEIPENVTYIGTNALAYCDNLETIVIKAKNVTMENFTGRDNPALKAVYIHSETISFNSTGMIFTNRQTGDASGITFYVSNQSVADALYNASTSSQGYGMLIKSIDGNTTYYDTLK